MSIRIPDEILPAAAPKVELLTLDDLEQIAFTYGGTIEPRPGGRFMLVGTVIDGRRINLGPVPGPVRVEVAP